MDIRNGRDAIQFIREWENDAAIPSPLRTARAVKRALESARVCLGLTPKHCPSEAEGYSEAIEVFENYLKTPVPLYRLDVWRQKYCGAFPDATKDRDLKLRALTHALKKWLGLKPEVLKEHGLVRAGRNIIPESLSPATALANRVFFPVDRTTCTLCTFYSEETNKLPDCSKCPLFELRGAACSVAVYPEPAPFYVWVRCGNAEPMIELIKRAIEALPKKGAR